jgi:hypothetical protein
MTGFRLKSVVLILMTALVISDLLISCSVLLHLTVIFIVATQLNMASTAPEVNGVTGLRRVVVTGMGITSCLGNTLDDVKTSLHEAKPGIKFSQEYADLGIKSQVCGKPDLSDDDFKELIPKAALRFMGMNAKYAYIAMKRAIEDAGMKDEDYQENPRAAGILGQGGTSIPDIVETVDAVHNGGKRWKNKVGPFRVTRSMGSTTSAVLSTMFKLQGPSWSISSACSTGAHCIGTGMELIQLGKSDIAFCGAGMLHLFLCLATRIFRLYFLNAIMLLTLQERTRAGNLRRCLTVWVPCPRQETRTQNIPREHLTRTVMDL